MSTNYIQTLSKKELNSIIIGIKQDDNNNKVSDIINKLTCTSKNLTLLKLFITLNIYSKEDLITNINCNIRKAYTILGLKHKLDLSPEKCKQIKKYIC